jgi:inosose dehydratase
MKLAFSKPTNNDAERQMLFSRFRSFGYEGLQLKYAQYQEYIDEPARFIEQYGAEAKNIASGLIVGGQLDATGIAELRSLFRFAQAVGSERIIFCHTKSRQGLEHSDMRGFAQLLSDLGKEAQQQYGVSLSLHHHYHQPVMHRQDFKVFFGAVSDGAVRLTVDTAHLVKSGINDIAGVIRDYHEFLDNVHCKDIENGDFKVLGQGTIDFGPVFAALREIGYTGWISADEESGSELIEAMEMCARFLMAQRV